MRKLINEDMYLISEIIDKMNFTMPSDKKLENGKEVKKSQQEIGNEIITQITKKIYLAKEQVNQLLANITEKSTDEISKMPLTETFNLIGQLFKKGEFKDFFK
jgi:hypothetical protein